MSARRQQHWILALVLLHGIAAERIAAAPRNSTAAHPARTKSGPVVSLSINQANLLQTWYRSVGPPRPGERFGHLVARAALHHRGRRYHAPKQIDQKPGQAERMSLKLSNFDCVSLIESSMALGRCVWGRTPTAHCFATEIIASRFRGGRRGDYADRLHYFSEWLRDNAGRGRLAELSQALGGRSLPRPINYMSRRPAAYPALRHPATLRKIRAVESRLTRSPARVVRRAGFAKIQPGLYDGDIVAIVTNVRGILVTHAGLVVRVRGLPRLLHASRYHKGVVLDGASISNYLNRRPERLGVMVARPRPPAR